MELHVQIVKIPVLLFLFALFIHLLCPFSVFPQEGQRSVDHWSGEKNRVPLSTLFFNLGDNALGSHTFNYGSNFAAAEDGKRYFLPAIGETQGSNALLFSFNRFIMRYDFSFVTAETIGDLTDSLFMSPWPLTHWEVSPGNY
jgi:Na+/proline symporter